MKYVCLVLALVTTLAAGDATGKWKGTLTITNPQGETRTLPAIMVLKQEGNVLTGTAGPEEDQQPIANGKVEGEEIRFDFDRDGGVMRFKLKLAGDYLAGEVTREREGQTQRATVALKREK
ncbi:MAG: hypothetical protein SFV54_18630 [Bryobacteraceae bacterium]|nr:hypothetical protein [Bryobacteraceae bacterium]